MIAGPEQGKQGGRLGSEPAGERHGTNAAVQIGHPLFKCSYRGIHNPGVGIAVLLQVKICRRCVRILEYITGGLVDRSRTRAGGGVRSGTRMHGAGFETEFMVGHGYFSWPGRAMYMRV